MSSRLAQKAVEVAHQDKRLFGGAARHFYFEVGCDAMGAMPGAAAAGVGMSRRVSQSGMPRPLARTCSQQALPVASQICRCLPFIQRLHKMEEMVSLKELRAIVKEKFKEYKDVKDGRVGRAHVACTATERGRTAEWGGGTERGGGVNW